ncbi:hypothetical protein ACFLT7_01750 [candidate division KSB1 bacterium]
MRVYLFLVLCLLVRSAVAGAVDSVVAEHFRLARSRGFETREAFNRSRMFLQGWLSYKDEETALFPQRFIQPGERLWTPENAAADLYPFMVLAAFYTDRELYHGLLRQTLADELRLTTVTSGLVTAYDLIGDTLVARDLDRLIFGTSEYIKDALVPIAEVTGREVWLHRQEELVRAVLRASPVATSFGNIPSGNAEVNGEMLQSLARLAAMSGDPYYLDWIDLLLRVYLREILPRSGGLPCHHWDFETGNGDDILRLRDHGAEILGGLVLGCRVLGEKRPGSEKKYEESIRRMLDRVLEIGTNEDGLFYNAVGISSGEVRNERLSDCWGYNYQAFYAFDPDHYRTHIGKVLGRMGKYRNYPWEGDISQKGRWMDGYADAIEGALALLNRIPVREGFDWVDSEIKIMYSAQKEDGTIEGWHGDGNFARTALMYGLYKSQGTYLLPYRDDLRIGAAPGDGELYISIESETPYEGRLHFDYLRHKLVFGFQRNYPRINEFPEWAPVEFTRFYRLLYLDEDRRQDHLGWDLVQGIPVKLDGREPLRIIVKRP